MTDETRKEIAEKKARVKAEKKRDRKNARIQIRQFITDFTLMNKIIKLADNKEDFTEVFEELMNK